MTRIGAALIVLLATSVSISYGAPVYGTAAPIGSGTRVEASQITTGDRYAGDNQTFTVSWDISFNPTASIYSYSYVFTGFSDPELSNFVMDLSDNCIEPGNQSRCVFNISSSGSPTRSSARLAPDPATMDSPRGAASPV